METKSYEWVQARYSVPADKAGAEMERVRQKRGELTASALVEESRPKKAVLHEQFEWDDARAGELWRLAEARKMIRCLAIKLVGKKQSEPVKVRAFVGVRSDQSAKKGTAQTRNYLPAQEVVTDEYLMEKVLHELWTTLMSYKRQIDQLDGLAEIAAELESTAHRVRKKLDDNRSAAAG